MLNKLIENSRNKCARYWPEEVGHEMQFEVGNIIYKVTLLGTGWKHFFVFLTVRFFLILNIFNRLQKKSSIQSVS